MDRAATLARIAQLHREAREYREYKRDPHCSQNHRRYEAERREEEAHQLTHRLTISTNT